MTGISFANPGYLWFLVLVPGMIAFYIFRQQKTFASLQMPGLKPFERAGSTFRNYVRHILFALRTTAVALLIIVLARPPENRQISECYNRRRV